MHLQTPVAMKPDLDGLHDDDDYEKRSPLVVVDAQYDAKGAPTRNALCEFGRTPPKTLFDA
jgi:hypothetical protein